MTSKNWNNEKQNKNYPTVVIPNVSDATTQQSRRLSSEEVERELQYSKVEKNDKLASSLHKTPKPVIKQYISENDKDQLKHLSSTSSPVISSTSRDDELSCEVSDVDTTDVKENSSSLLSKNSSSTMPTTMSGKTTVNEINEVVEEISSRIQYTTLTYERLNRIKNYFAASKIFTSSESDAFGWITDNMQTIYNDPINACKKLRIAIGNRSIPINFAIKALQPFVENHTICMTDMIKYCSYEGRNDITINELSQILKRLIKMNIKHILFDDSGRTPTVSFQNSSCTYQL